MDKPFEHILQSAYTNMQHDLRGLIPANTLFYGAALERLGQYKSASLQARHMKDVD